MVRVGGSSPLTRGKPIGIGKRNDSAGLIPAHAGRTAGRRDRAPAGAAHPRSRGENSVPAGPSHSVSGSSPLTRGKPCGVHIYDLTDGLIPAHAGKTRQDRESYAGSWAHPRSRGENRATGSSAARQRGSSPLTRGKQRRRLVRRVGGGLIPAHAGKTSRRRPPSSPNGAHPRSRGENRIGPPGWCGCGGSSPLTRGKHFTELATNTLRGLIPAHAGKTCSGLLRSFA